MSPSDRLSPKQAAEYLGRSLPWFRRNWRALGIPAYPLGPRYVYNRLELDSWLERQRKAS
jgi:excisionase family DNA binding protein